MRHSKLFSVTALLGVSWPVVGVSAFVPSTTTNVPLSVSGDSSSKLHMATWSDSKAVMDYQNFLASGRQEPEMKPDMASVIITNGPCELTEALYTMGMGDDVVITPFQDLPPFMDGNAEYPIYVALPPWQIFEFIKGMPESYMDRYEDFVFFSGGLQYGNIEDVLKECGFCRDATTQVLISGLKFTAAKRVQDLSVRIGTSANEEEKWAGECSACGKWQGSIADRIKRNNIRCQTEFYRDWRRRMWEQSLLDAVFNLMGAVRNEPTSVQQVANYYSNDASEMLWEMSGLLRGWKALTIPYGFEERIFGVAEVNGGEQPCTLIDAMYPFIWGNRVFLESQTYMEYLYYAQSERGLLQEVQLPPMQEKGTSVMRPGILRADGVI